MPYLVIIAKGAVGISKNFLPSIKHLISKELEFIAHHPYQATQLKGKFSFLRSWHMYIRGVSYRIIFEIEDGTKRVFVYLIAKRADAYKILERLF